MKIGAPHFSRLMDLSFEEPRSLEIEVTALPRKIQLLTLPLRFPVYAKRQRRNQRSLERRESERNEQASKKG